MNRLALMLVSTAFAASSLPTPAVASDIFMCVDADGNKVFQNVGSGKGCKRMDVGPVLSMPASRVPQQRAPGASENRVTVSPANFPRVDRDTQRSMSLGGACNRCELSGRDLSGATFTAATFTSSTFVGASLRGAEVVTSR